MSGAEPHSALAGHSDLDTHERLGDVLFALAEDMAPGRWASGRSDGSTIDKLFNTVMSRLESRRLESAPKENAAGAGTGASRAPTAVAAQARAASSVAAKARPQTRSQAGGAAGVRHGPAPPASAAPVALPGPAGIDFPTRLALNGHLPIDLHQFNLFGAYKDSLQPLQLMGDAVFTFGPSSTNQHSRNQGELVWDSAKDAHVPILGPGETRRVVRFDVPALMSPDLPDGVSFCPDLEVSNLDPCRCMLIRGVSLDVDLNLSLQLELSEEVIRA